MSQAVPPANFDAFEEAMRNDLQRMMTCWFCKEPRPFLDQCEGPDTVPDACLGWLPGVRNACCGHGFNVPYVQFDDMSSLNGGEALDYFQQQGKGPTAGQLYARMGDFEYTLRSGLSQFVETTESGERKYCTKLPKCVQDEETEAHQKECPVAIAFSALNDDFLNPLEVSPS